MEEVTRLELRHIACYLPYGLEGITKRGTVFRLGISSNMRGEGIEDREIGTWLNESIKPLLRPLSDLKKEIEVNGEKFVPMEKLKSIFTKRLRFDNDGFYYHISESVVRGERHDTHFPFNQLEAYSYLFRWHFDVFNLIEKGLATDLTLHETSQS